MRKTEIGFESKIFVKFSKNSKINLTEVLNNLDLRTKIQLYELLTLTSFSKEKTAHGSQGKKGHQERNEEAREVKGKIEEEIAKFDRELTSEVRWS